MQRIPYSCRLSYVQSTVFHTAFGWAFHRSEAGAYVQGLTGFAYPCDDAGRTRPRAGRRAGPPRVPSRPAGTVAEQPNEKVRLGSRKGPRSADSARFVHSLKDTILDFIHIFTIGTGKEHPPPTVYHDSRTYARLSPINGTHRTPSGSKKRKKWWLIVLYSETPIFYYS